jgi:hypothetical protein
MPNNSLMVLLQTAGACSSLQGRYGWVSSIFVDPTSDADLIFESAINAPTTGNNTFLAFQNAAKASSGNPGVSDRNVSPLTL